MSDTRSTVPLIFLALAVALNAVFAAYVLG